MIYHGMSLTLEEAQSCFSFKLENIEIGWKNDVLSVHFLLYPVGTISYFDYHLLISTQSVPMVTVLDN